tara:strand:- start:217 stop:381 length:165 start_codon:yes stop_codon:yes gene_type:complete
MSGDNLYGKQPIKFYSEDLTVTKIILIKNHFKFEYKDIINHEEYHIEIKKLLAS